MYRGYEEYMQNVLGYNANLNTYSKDIGEYYAQMQVSPNMQETNKFYPEIYKIVYPVIQKVCGRRNLSNITEEQISQMVEEVYSVIEPGDDVVEQGEAPLRNGDVRNPRAKETRQILRRNNPMLRDLIRILLLRELFQGGRSGFYPGRPGPGVPGGPGNMPPPPPRPGAGGPGPVRPR